MDILLLDALIPEAMAWLGARHSVALRPELADDAVALRKAAYKTRAIVFPRQTVLTRELLDFLPMLKAVGRLHAAHDNTSLEACNGRGVTVIQAGSAHVRSNAEYLLSGLLLLYRRGVVSALMGRRHPTSQVGRELHGSTVGILGLSPTAHTLAGMLTGLGVRVIGYDPAIHHTAPIWGRSEVEPVALTELMGQADAVSVQMLYAARFRGFVNDKLLACCKPGQLWVGISRSELFDQCALAAALCDGRIEACILDGAEAGFRGETSPLRDLKNLFVTPRLGAHTREARLRASWYVAHRIHETISRQPGGEGPLPNLASPGESVAEPQAGPPPAYSPAGEGAPTFIASALAAP
ncbi:MAG: NAD(P)-dependent oxidoreductase [Polaromonas sp.]